MTPGIVPLAPNWDQIQRLSTSTQTPTASATSSGAVPLISDWASLTAPIPTAPAATSTPSVSQTPSSTDQSAPTISPVAQTIVNATKSFLENTKVDPSMYKLKATPSETTSSTTQDIPLTQQYTNLKELGAVTTPYGGSTKFEKFHPGIDIANKIGTPIPSFASGTVVAEESGKKQGDKGYGNNIIIQDDQGNLHRYSHLSNEYVKVGDVVKPGQTIGTIGNTGSTYSTSGGTGAHLDYRIKSAAGKYLNPNLFLNSYFKGV